MIFIQMANRHIAGELEAIDPLYSLARGPATTVRSYKGCVINGLRFRTLEEDEHHTTQNSGVVVSAEHREKYTDFYGSVKDIFELSYPNNKTVLVFKCSWYDVGDARGIRRCASNFTTVNVSRTWYKQDPYILASQAQQVFYAPDDVLGVNWRVVQKIPPRSVYLIPKENDGIRVSRYDEDEAYQQPTVSSEGLRVNEAVDVSRPVPEPPAVVDTENLQDSLVEDYATEDDTDYQSSDGSGDDTDDSNEDTDLD